MAAREKDGQKTDGQMYGWTDIALKFMAIGETDGQNGRTVARRETDGQKSDEKTSQKTLQRL